MSKIDPRGIRRRIVAVECKTTETLITMEECNHVNSKVQHFTYKIGDIVFCYKCKKPE